MRYVLGIDIGTSSVKAALFDRAGHRAALGTARCSVIRRAAEGERSTGAWVEHDPRQAWEAVAKATRQLWRDTGVRSTEVAAVGLSGHFSTVFLDESGAPAAPCLTWLDTRAREEAEWLATEFGTRKMAHLLGIRLPVSAAMPPARVLWVSRHCPSELARTAWTAQTKDFVGWRLHGRRVSDPHSLMGLVQVPDGRISPGYLAALGLPPRLLPELARPWEVVGQVTPEAARVTGLAAGTPVVAGWIDAYCSMLGTGMGDPRLGFDVAGTSEVVGLVTAGRVRTRDLRGQLVIPLIGMRIAECGLRIGERPEGSVQARLRTSGCESAAETSLAKRGEQSETGGVTAVYGLTNAGADSLTWARQAWGRGLSYAALLAEAEAIPAAADAPVFLPYLEGERSPLWDETVRGALLGLGRQHGRGHLVRAVLEGVAFSVRHNLECACQVAARTVEGVRLSGGGARSAVWNQVKADVLGLPVHLVSEPEAGALGAAMLAAMGLGWYPGLEAAVAGTVRADATWEPRAELREAYDALYRRYRQLSVASS